MTFLLSSRPSSRTLFAGPFLCPRGWGRSCDEAAPPTGSPRLWAARPGSGNLGVQHDSSEQGHEGNVCLL